MSTKLNIELSPRENHDGAYKRGTQENPQESNKKSKLLAHIVLALVVVNIIILYILHFVDNGGSSSAVTSTYSVKDTFASSQEPVKGLAVSFNDEGLMQTGAGTTAYLDAAALPDTKESMQHLHFTKVGEVTLVSYATGLAPELQSIVSVMETGDNSNDYTIAKPSNDNIVKGSTIKQIVGLSDKLGVALVATTSADGMSVTNDIMPIQVEGSSSAKLVSKSKAVAAEGTPTVFLAPLSEDSFIVAAFEPYTADADFAQLLKVGKVSSNKITFTEDLQFGTPNGNSSTTVFGRPIKTAATKFAVPWFTQPGFGASSGEASESKGLCLTLVELKSEELSDAGEVCSQAYQPKYYVESTHLDEKTVALTFVDQNNNYALTVAIVEFSEVKGTATFRSSFTVPEVSGDFDFGAAFGFSPQPRVSLLSGNRLAIGFLNPANSGKPSVKIMNIFSDLSVGSSSPVLPIANAKFTLSSSDPNSFGAIVVDMVAMSDNELVLGYSGSFGGQQLQRIAVVESLGKPTGILTDASSGEAKVASSGTVKVNNGDFKAGNKYFASTEGKVYAASTITNDAFIIADDGKKVISKDAFVGIAVSSDELVVSI